ncbi:MAG: ZIP family metal transporter [Candidatus Diapherotrites archaeon]|nr:ZIP family metal transporter [Candidatus Diapherotrites archaeon]
MVLELILLSTFAVSLIAFIGILVLFIKEKLLNKILFFLVNLSAGALMGGALLHLIPEAAEIVSFIDIGIWVLIGFSLFYLVETILKWRHCHDIKCKIHTFAYMNLLGDGVHNFIDGLVIAASYIISIPLGIATTLAVALHEVPQEIGDFGVLVYGGFDKVKAVIMNFIFALTAIFGGIFAFFVEPYLPFSIALLLPFAAGNFIYISASDLLPETRKESNRLRSLILFSIFLLGVGLMWAVRFI